MLSKTVGRKVSVASRISVVLAVAMFALCASRAGAQTTEFTYQGKLNDGGAPAAGSYDFEFRLHDAESGGAPLATQQRLDVTVAGGVFSVRLDFGASFTGGPRWLEIAVKPAGSADPLTTLNPRQPITSAPYGIRSLTAGLADAAADAEKLGGVDASQYVVTSDARLSDARPPTVGSAHYIQSGTAPQAASNFNITGNGTIGGDLTVGGSFSLNIVNAQTQYNIGGSRVLSTAGNSNIFAGRDSGASNTTGEDNAFFGNHAGRDNATGNQNSFFGAFAGRNNVMGNYNSFFGRSAGIFNTTGSLNSFFGVDAGRLNTTGGDNSFFGVEAGRSNTTGNDNSFFGRTAGDANTVGNFNAIYGSNAGGANVDGSHNSFFGTSAGSQNLGSNNSFFGRSAGNTNTVGSSNTVIGYHADVASGDLNFATAIGADAVVSSSNTLVLGRSADTVQIPGNLNVAGNLTGGGIVKSVNGLNGDVTLAAGSNVTITPSGNTLTIASTGGGGGSLTVTEQDGTPSVSNVTELRVSNGTLTANGGGSVSLATGGGSAGAILNQTSQQSSANFNIDGTGTANIFTATRYRIGGSGVLIMDASGNLFAGRFAGESNTQGQNNSFVGNSAGSNNTMGDSNSFFGAGSGFANTTGDDNVFLGRTAGETNTTGDDNTIIGSKADVGSSGLTHATAIGAGAVVSTSNTVQLGRNNGNDTVRVPGRLVVNKLGSAGSAHLCRNAAGQLAACSSSLRYKTNIAPFRLGLNLVERLRPITFAWKDDGARDLGLGAEDVARVEPLLVTYNREGQIEGVKYDRVAVVLLNAVREQQTQIRQQQQQLEQQQLVIDGLRQLICQANPQAQVCRK